MACFRRFFFVYFALHEIDRNVLSVLCFHVDSAALSQDQPSSTVPVLLSTFQLFKVLSTRIRRASSVSSIRRPPNPPRSRLFDHSGSTRFSRSCRLSFDWRSIAHCQEVVKRFLIEFFKLVVSSSAPSRAPLYHRTCSSNKTIISIISSLLLQFR